MEQLTNAIRDLDLFAARDGDVSSRQARVNLVQFLSEYVYIQRCQSGSIWLLDAARREVRCALGHEQEHERLASFRLPAGEGLTGICAATGQPLVINDVAADRRHHPTADKILGTGVRQMLSCPLLYHGEAIGVLNVVNRIAGAPPFGEADLLVAKLFALSIANYLVEHHLLGVKPPKRKERSASHADPPNDASDDSAIEPVLASPAMREAAERIRSSAERPLLITGESGVGKDVLARYAHRVSKLAHQPFVRINCAAIQTSLWESEIFGHARGAFTGADRDKAGYVEAANGGTLFLNEVGELPLACQAKLLTFLDSGEYQRVGETKTRRSRVRVISATNSDLRRAMRDKRFRRDLYYRLAHIHLQIPPLRERPSDITSLAVQHLTKLSKRAGVEPPWLDASATDLLIREPWEGNVRELFAWVETAFQACLAEESGMLQARHFGSQLPATFSAPQHRDGVPSMHHAAVPTILPGSDIFANPEGLRSFLDQHRCATSARWNLSVAWRRLSDAGAVQMSLRTFIRRVQKAFPTGEQT